MATSPEGIMALEQPQEAMGASPAMPELTRSDFYDISRQALKTARPDLDLEMEEELQALRAIADTLPEQALRIFLNIFQSILDHPEDYKEALQALREVAPELATLLPKEFDEEFYATVAFIFEDALKSRQAPGTASVEGIEAMMPQRFAKGGIAEAARLVASQGRGGDTMLAHINPREAQLLKAFGGSGTINPKTGQPEFIFGWIKKNIVDPVIGAGKAVVKAVTGVVKGAVDLIKKSPIARVAATIALTYALGPAGFKLMSLPAAAATASGTITAATGGNLKDIALSSVTAYIGAPGGPISTAVGKYAPAFIASNPLVREAVSGTLAGTAGGLIYGRSLADSVRGGLTEGAISAGLSLATGGNIQKASMDAADATLAKTIDDAVVPNAADPIQVQQLKQDALVTAKLDLDQVQAAQVAPPPSPPDLTDIVGKGAQGEIDRALAQAQGQIAPGVTEAVPMDSGIARLTPQELDPGSSLYQRAGTAPNISGKLPPPDILTTADVEPVLTGIDEQRRAAISGVSLGDTTFGELPSQQVAGATAAIPDGGIGSLKKVPTVMESFQKIGRGDILEGAGDLFMPSGPSVDDIVASPEFASLRNQGLSADKALQILQESPKYNPSMLRTYGPGAVAGITALGLSGAFTPKPPELSEESQRFQEQMRGPIDLSEDPGRYYLQNIPGVVYDERGAVVGTGTSQPTYTIADVAERGGYTPYSAPTGGAYMPSAFMSPYGEQYLNQGGIASLAREGYPRRTGQISGPGTETSDDIPAMLSDGEFVMTARAVRGMGNGSRREGARKMYALMHKLEQNASRG